MKRTLLSLPLIAVAALSQAQVMSNTIGAIDNATVQPGGPRSGSSGKAFMNVEGSDNGNFSSYGVIDFDGTTVNFASAISSVTSVTLKLTQSNAAFSTTGAVKFYLTSDITTDIQPGTSPLAFDLTNPPGGIKAGDLGTLFELGTGMYTVGTNGDVDSYTFNVSGGAASLLGSSLGAGGSNVRFVVAADATNTAATWTGFTNTTFSGPQVMFEGEAVPEPATMAIFGLGALAAMRRRSRKA